MLNILYVVWFIKDIENWLLMLNCRLFVIHPKIYHNQSSFQHVLRTTPHIKYLACNKQNDIFNIQYLWFSHINELGNQSILTTVPLPWTRKLLSATKGTVTWTTMCCINIHIHHAYMFKEQLWNVPANMRILCENNDSKLRINVRTNNSWRNLFQARSVPDFYRLIERCSADIVAKNHNACDGRFVNLATHIFIYLFIIVLIAKKANTNNKSNNKITRKS